MWGDFSRKVWYLHLAWHACSLSQLDELVKQRVCAPLSWMKPNRTFWTLVVEGLVADYCMTVLHSTHAMLCYMGICRRVGMGIGWLVGWWWQGDQGHMQEQEQEEGQEQGQQ